MIRSVPRTSYYQTINMYLRKKINCMKVLFFSEQVCMYLNQLMWLSRSLYANQKYRSVCGKNAYYMYQLVIFDSSVVLLLQCLSLLVLNSPYNRLKQGLLTKVARQLRPLLALKGKLQDLQRHLQSISINFKWSIVNLWIWLALSLFSICC